MNRVAVVLVLMLMTWPLFGQSDLCFDNAKGSYWPIKVGMKTRYASESRSYATFFNGDSLKVGDKYYLKEISEYSDGKTSVMYWRTEDDVIYFYDVDEGMESIELINDFTPGTTWEKNDKSWKYTIVDTVSAYSTPFCKFTNLLQVKVEPQNEMKDQMSHYNLFFKRGVGMIGMNVNGKPFSFIKPEKGVNDRSFIAYGCEKLGSANEQQQCTYEMIQNHIKKEFKARRRGYKPGRMLLNVVIGVDGAVEDVRAIETIDGAELQEKELLRIVRSLPRMIPAQVDDGKPIVSSLQVPVNF